jgi:phosphate transport system substrate-binding protein
MSAQGIRLAIIAVSMIIATGASVAKDISIVGSSTVYPFMKIVVKEFSSRSPSKVTLEATGTGTGFDYFCAGKDEFLPDINTASRPMLRDDLRNCRRNGVRDIVAFAIGFDGIVAFSAQSQSFPDLSRVNLYRSLAHEVLLDGKFTPNPFTNWTDISPTLPATPIRVLGPPASSGTRNYIENFVLGELCLWELGERGTTRPELMRSRCEKVRTDGGFIEVGEDDEFLIQSVQASKGAIGLVGYGQYLTQQSKLHAISVDGVLPSFDNISSGRYGLSRPLFVYVKRDNLERKPEIAALLRLFSEQAVIERLARAGLVPLPEEQLRENVERLQSRKLIECPSRYCDESRRQ